VLEELEHAKARGAKIYAEYVGGAFTCDAHHMTEPQPQGRGVSSCLHKALQSAGRGGWMGRCTRTGDWLGGWARIWVTGRPRCVLHPNPYLTP
jgi:hypothetical protein